MQKSNLLLLLIWFITSCSTTNVTVQKPSAFKNKKIAVANIEVTAVKKSNRKSTDTVCACTAQSIQQAFLPHLQQAGFTVINIPINQSTDILEAVKIAESLQVDYVLAGAGQVDIVGKSTFMEQLTVKIMSTKTGEVLMSGSFTGTSIRPVNAANKIGEEMVKKINKS